MKQVIVPVLLLFFLSFTTKAQNGNPGDSVRLIKLNQEIDNYVVQKNINALDSLYADDFVFSHGTGKVDDKKSWLLTVGSLNYLVRRHDSVAVELHPAMGILRGKLYVERADKDKTDRYRLKYIRLFAFRAGRWQMISHITTLEQHEP